MDYFFLNHQHKTRKCILCSSWPPLAEINKPKFSCPPPGMVQVDDFRLVQENVRQF